VTLALTFCFVSCWMSVRRKGQALCHYTFDCSDTMTFRGPLQAGPLKQTSIMTGIKMSCCFSHKQRNVPRTRSCTKKDPSLSFISKKLHVASIYITLQDLTKLRSKIEFLLYENKKRTCLHCKIKDIPVTGR
jgi:hypothetical protein